VPDHTLGWVDDYSGAVYCSEDKEKDYFIIDANCPPIPCPNCGKMLELFWNTYLIEDGKKL